MTVVGQPGSSYGEVRRLTVDVSYDDGRTWNRAPLIVAPGGRQVLLDHPAGTGFVSLRANVADGRGNTTEQTIIRAYRIAP